MASMSIFRLKLATCIDWELHTSIITIFRSAPGKHLGLHHLSNITLGNNMVVGEIPHGLAYVLELIVIDIYNNYFTRKFPNFFVNFSSLVFISGVIQQIQGKHPTHFWTIVETSISGTIPISIFNMTSLAYIWFVRNQLEGIHPLDLGIIIWPDLFFLH